MERFIFLSMNRMRKGQLMVARRYHKKLRRKEKSIILDEYCSNTGYNRDYTITKIRKILINLDPISAV
jgi:hypothetical protein